MTYRLDQLPAAQFLTDAEQRDLIVTVNSQVLFGRTPAVEAAEERLVMAFLPAIKRAARTSKVQDTEDALGNVLEEFLRAIRKYNTADDVPFHAVVGRILASHISDTDRTSGVIRIPEAPAARYWRLMHTHSMDVESAYRACQDTATGIAPMSFLAIHHAMTGALSLDYRPANAGDVMREGGEGGHFNAEYGAGPLGEASRIVTPGPEERAVEQHLISWLFTLVSATQETILRLIHGFMDSPTETVRFDAGYKTGQELDDGQAAHALGMSRPTVQRQKSTALKTMREAMQALVLEEEA